jgi:hypothetical protein
VSFLVSRAAAVLSLEAIASGESAGGGAVRTIRLSVLLIGQHRLRVRVVAREGFGYLVTAG